MDNLCCFGNFVQRKSRLTTNRAAAQVNNTTERSNNNTNSYIRTTEATVNQADIANYTTNRDDYDGNSDDSSFPEEEDVCSEVDRPLSTNTIEESLPSGNIQRLDSVNLRVNDYGRITEDYKTYMSLAECMSGVSLTNGKYKFVELYIMYKDAVESHDGEATEDTSTNTTQARDRKSLIVQELIATEKSYVQDLAVTVEQYKPFLEGHLNSSADIAQIFGNIEEIYKLTLTFSEELQHCSHEDYNAVANLFIRFENLFKLYPDYAANKSKSLTVLTNYEDVAHEMQKKLKDGIGLSSRMLAPIQRLGRYVLLLENLLKELNVASLPNETVEKSLNIVKKWMSKSNGRIAALSIKFSPINMEEAAGEFIMMQNFEVVQPRRFQSNVFMFENIIVFTVDSKNSKEEFIYVDSIAMDALNATTFPSNDRRTLVLKNYLKHKETNSRLFTYKLRTSEEGLVDFWKTTIEDRLWEQLECQKNAGRGPVDVAGPSQDSLQPYRAEQYQEELLQRNSEEFHQQSSTGRRLIRVPTALVAAAGGNTMGNNRDR